MPMLLLIAFFSALAVAIHAIGAAFDGLAAGLAALPQDHATAPQPPVDPGPPPSAIVGETYAEFLARTGAQIFGPGGHEINGNHVFGGEAWAPQTA